MSRLAASLLLSATAATFAAAPAIAAPTWSPPQTVEWLHHPEKLDQLRGSMKVEADAQGNEVAAWLDASTDGRWAITVSSRPVNDTWKPATRFFIPPTQYPEYLDVKLDVSATGWAVASWIEGAGANGAGQSRFVTRTPAGVWSQPTTAQPAGSSEPEYYTTEIGPSGELSVTWLRSGAPVTPDEPTTTPVVRKLRPAGSSTFVDDRLEASYNSQPQFDAAGNALVIDFATDGGLTSQSRTSSGSWQSPQRVAPPADEAAGLGPVGPTVQWEFAPDGSVVAMWLRNVDGLVALQTVRRSAAGVWGPVTTLDRFADFPSNILTGYSLALGKAGATIAWSLITIDFETSGRSQSEIFAAVAGPTGGWSAKTPLAPKLINTSPAQGNSYNSVRTAVGDSVALTTWSTATGPAAGAQFTAGQSTWSAPFALPTAPKATNLATTMAPNGTASVIWGEGDRLRWSTAALSGGAAPTPTPTPTPRPARTVRIDSGLTALTGQRCPASVQIAVNGRRVGTLPVAGAGAARCRVTGTVPVSSSLKAGTTVLVTITGNGLTPAAIVARVN